MKARPILATAFATLLAGCGTPGYAPNGFHLPKTSGGYIDRKSDQSDVFIAEFWSEDPTEIKNDYALLRALERAYRAGFRYAVVREHGSVKVVDQYYSTLEPRYVIQAFGEPIDDPNSFMIYKKAEEIMKRRGLLLQSFENEN